MKAIIRAWMKFGELAGKVVTPLVLAVVFFVLITPLAVVLRLLGRDELRLQRQSGPTCWIERDPPGPGADSFPNQF